MTFTYRSVVSAPAEEVFGWHARPEALQELLPRLPPVRILNRAGGIADGGRVTLAIGVWPLRLTWEARHFGYVPGRRFCDEQVRGPFRRWVHVHAVEPLGDRASLLEDRIDIAIGGGPLRRLGELLLRAILRRAFAARHRVVRERLARRRRAGPATSPARSARSSSPPA